MATDVVFLDRAALIKRIEGWQVWDPAQISAAVDAALANSAQGWRWEVGTRGSMHFASGWAPTECEADQSESDSLGRTLSGHPAIGSLPSTTYRETVPQRNQRVLMAALEILHS